MKQLQESLNQLWAGTIKKHTIDLFNHTIEFEIETLNYGKNSFYSLKFLQVKSFFYLNDQEPIEPEQDDYLELTSVYYETDESIKVEVNSLKESEYFRTTMINFMLEIWGSEMCINAASVEVNGKLYEAKLLR